MPEEPLQRQLVVFSLGEEEYALPITQVHEIIRYTEPRSVASTDPSVRGVISLRGKILPVYDLATRLGVEHAESSEAKIVIVETADDMAGVDRRRRRGGHHHRRRADRRGAAAPAAAASTASPRSTTAWWSCSIPRASSALRRSRPSTAAEAADELRSAA